MPGASSWAGSGGRHGCLEPVKLGFQSLSCSDTLELLGDTLPVTLGPQLLHLLNGHRIGARVNLKSGRDQSTIGEFSFVFVAVWGLNPAPAHSGKCSGAQLSSLNAVL